ncbi:hypothetical protein KUCAC02_012604 [Chaenocephalus aceratus]|uniref:Uncharacterized protein n=1 Tax=Chaenocephalus aceratus TaxID=36190 RepID=A0ACB9XB20_CHAAC|nr:hypothetical protein KUCAC02_012604 [Chaenocephalus aceratus]
MGSSSLYDGDVMVIVAKKEISKSAVCAGNSSIIPLPRHLRYTPKLLMTVSRESRCCCLLALGFTVPVTASVPPEVCDCKTSSLTASR